MLYDLLLDAPIPSTDPTSSKPPNIPYIDGIIGSVTQTSNKSSLKKIFISTTASNPPSNPSPIPSKNSEVNFV